MKERSRLRAWLALAAPLLVLLALLALLMRSGSDRLQALPPLLIGIGLLLSSAAGRARQRRHLLVALRQTDA
jgi:hypothetical protein